MNAMEIQAHAQKLYQAHGAKALAEAYLSVVTGTKQAKVGVYGEKN